MSASTLIRSAAEAHWRDRGVEFRTWASVRRLQGSSYQECVDEMEAVLGWAPSRETFRRWIAAEGLDEPAAVQVYLHSRGLDLDRLVARVDGATEVHARREALDEGDPGYLSPVTPEPDGPDEDEPVYGDSVTPSPLVVVDRGVDPVEALREARERLGGRA